MSDSPLVSVVTPFYNTARWLPTCIESVLAQTWTDFEYILVDNCSTDGGHEIAADYARRDSRIRLIRTERLLPQIENYNFALRQLSPHSRYCKLIQADDWLYSHSLQLCVEAAEERDDIDLVCGFVHWDATIIPSGLQIDQRILSGRDACRMFFLQDKYLFGSPTAQFWRADAVRRRHDFFDAELAPFEDAGVCFELLDGRSFAFVHQILCFSRREPGSMLDRLVGSGWPQAHRLQTLRLFGKRYLTEAEYERIHEQWWREYRAVLAAAKLRKRVPEFEALHAQLMKAGHMEEAGRNLFWPMLALCFDRIANPKRTLENLFARRRARRDQSVSVGLQSGPSASGRTT